MPVIQARAPGIVKSLLNETILSALLTILPSENLLGHNEIFPILFLRVELIIIFLMFIGSSANFIWLLSSISSPRELGMGTYDG